MKKSEKMCVISALPICAARLDTWT